jgi:uncharacterized protein
MKFKTTNSNTYYINKRGNVSLKQENCADIKGVNDIEFIGITERDIEFELANLKQLTLEVTDACNLNCTYCAYGEFYCDYDERYSSNLQLEKVIKIIDYLNQYWNSDLNRSKERNVYISFYGGEPLMNMKLIKSVVEYINNISGDNRFFTFSMTTNGLLLNKYMDYLVQHDFYVLVSLDGDYNNNDYRLDKSGKSSFNRVVNNLDVLKKRFPEYFDNNISFNSVLHNKNSVNDIYNFFKGKYNKIPSIEELNDMGIKPEKKEQFLKTHKNYFDSLTESDNPLAIEKDMFIKSGTYQTLSTYIHRYSGFVYDDYNHLLFGKDNRLIPTGTCIPFSKRMFVTVSGKILPCERIGQQFALGSVGNDKVDLNLAEIVNKYNDYFNKIKRQCYSCKIASACSQCIYNIDSLEDKCICDGYTNAKDFSQYVASQIEFLESNPTDYIKIMKEIVID